MADDKRTKMGTGQVPVPRAPSNPVPPTDPPANKQTSYVPQTIAGDPLLGQTLMGRYSIVRKLGEGGMGSVYLATHNLLEKQIALKVLHGEFARKPDLVERFMQEAKAASRIRHENVIDISDFGKTDDGLVFFAMELLQGHDLHEEVARARLAGQLLPWSRSKKIFLQICSALSAAHGKGIIHRDLKPENVYLVDFLGDPDFVKLLDFGIAKLTEVAEGDRKLTRTGMLFGTPEYMSPEQARGDHVDHRVDVYAMGCILFQLVTGRVPFEAENFMGVLSLHLTEAPPQIPLDVFDRIGAPRDLARVIAKALEKDRNARWQTIDELANAVRTVCGDPLPSGSTGHIPQQRAPSVPAPAHTTEKVSVPATTPVPGSRVRTQWTGNLSVPQADDPEQKPKSKTPLVIAAAVVIAGGAIAAVIAVKNGGGKQPDPVGSASASGVASGSQLATVTPDAPPPDAPAITLPPPPAKVVVKLDSKPRNADIVDLTRNIVIGKTPLSFEVVGSNEPRPFALRLKGYTDKVFEIVPNQPYEANEKLEKIVGGTTPGSATRPPTGSNTTGSAGSAGSAAKPPETGSGSAKPCMEDPNEPGACLKQFNGSGSN